jgi:hypothetical protein
MTGWDALGYLLFIPYLILSGVQWVAGLPKRLWRKVRKAP